MNTARIAELLAPFLSTQASAEDIGPVELTETQLEYISIYIDILSRWSSHINLTAVRDPEEIVTRHFGESLFAARFLFPVHGTEKVYVADLGSGAGFPGIPLKLWAPHIQMTLIEANQKKVTFLREVVRALKLTGVEALACRSEKVSSRFHVVTLRAVERFGDVLPSAARLVAERGRLGLLIGKDQVPGVAKLTPEFEWLPKFRLPRAASRVLLIGNKV